MRERLGRQAEFSDRDRVDGVMPGPCPRTPALQQHVAHQVVVPVQDRQLAERIHVACGARAIMLHELPDGKCSTRRRPTRAGTPVRGPRAPSPPPRRARHPAAAAVRRRRASPGALAAQVNPPPRGLDLEPVQLRDQRDASPGEHCLSCPRRACQQPGLEGRQVTDEQGVLSQPPVNAEPLIVP